jgi:TolA-binding protein
VAPQSRPTSIRLLGPRACHLPNSLPAASLIPLSPNASYTDDDKDDGWAADGEPAQANLDALEPDAKSKPTTSKLQQYNRELAQQLTRVSELRAALEREQQQQQQQQQQAREQLDAQQRQVAEQAAQTQQELQLAREGLDVERAK